MNDNHRRGRDAAVLLGLVVATVLGMIAGAVPAPAQPTGGGGGSATGLAFREIKLLNSPVYGQSQRLSVSTNKAGDVSVSVYWSPSPDGPLVEPPLASGEPGTLAFPTAPRFTPGTDWYLVVVASNSDPVESVESSRIRFTTSKVQARVGFGPTSLRADERLEVRVEPQVDTGVPPSGRVTLARTGGASLGTADVVGGRALFQVPPSSGSLTATYSGDGAWTDATADATVTVAKAVVTPTATPSRPRVDRFGQLALEVRYRSSEPSYPPAGAMTILAEPAGATGPVVVLVESGYEGPQQTYDISRLTEQPPGSYDLYVLTSETDTLAFGSTEVGTVVVDPARVPVTVASEAPASEVPYGSPAVRVTGALQPSREAGAVDGALQLRVDDAAFGAPRAITSTAAVGFAPTTLEPGSYAVRVDYTGGTNYAESRSATHTLRIREAATTTRVTTTSTTTGGLVRVQVPTTDSPAPAAGAVTLREGGRAVATGTVRGGVADLRLPASVRPGSHTFTAVYTGSGTHTGSTSVPRAVRVAAPAPVASRVTGSAVRRGTAVTLRAVVSSAAPVTGRVQVLDGRRVVRTLALRATARGRLTTVVRGLRPGTHRLTVRYLGSSTVKGSARTWRVSVPRGR